MFTKKLLFATLEVAAAWGCSQSTRAMPDAGSQPVDYTFDTGREGWVLNTRQGSNFINLGAGQPDGGSTPTVSFAESDGDPSPGSLRLTVAFTGPGQYVAVGVMLGQARDLSGKTLHARVRRVSGPSAGVRAGFFACGSFDPAWGAVGTSCTDLAAQSEGVELVEGAWTPLAADVVPPYVGIPGPTFTPARVEEVGIEVYTLTGTDGGASDGGASASTGVLIFEIDSVTE